MFLPEGVEINNENRLVMAGVDLADTAERFGTPLYVYNEDLIRHKCREYHDRLADLYPKSRIAYAGKAFLSMAMCRLLEQEGLSLDVVSGGELYIAQRAGFPMKRIYFHGNNKSREELAMALGLGVGRIVIDNLAELEQLEKEAARQNRTASIMLRVKPGITAHTHHYIQTGQEDSKFGLGIADGQVMEAVQLARKLPHLSLRGLHCHIGSQILDPQPFSLAAEIMVALMERIRRKAGIVLKELNLGGGPGIQYTREDRPCSTADYLRLISDAVRRKAGEYGYPLPELVVEPGRSIVGEAGLTLYSIGAIKDVPGIRRYIAVDGGMTDNLRTALYGARYEAVMANRVEGDNRSLVTVAGKACESSDILIRDIELPAPAPGDILSVFSTGAYHFSMFSHYNRHLRPAVVFIGRGRAELVVRREEYADLTRLDHVPAHLESRAAGDSRVPVKKRSGAS